MTALMARARAELVATIDYIRLAVWVYLVAGIATSVVLLGGRSVGAAAFIGFTTIAGLAATDRQ
ncbi:MAG: hypothetical protein ACK5RL_09375 [Acidimicrobiales bacterium]